MGNWILMRGQSRKSSESKRSRKQHMHLWRQRQGSLLHRITAWCSFRLSFVFFSAFFTDGMADPVSSAHHERDVEQVSSLFFPLLILSLFPHKTAGFVIFSNLMFHVTWVLWNGSPKSFFFLEQCTNLVEWGRSMCSKSF